jgi:hypothetical protein
MVFLHLFTAKIEANRCLIRLEAEWDSSMKFLNRTILIQLEESAEVVTEDNAGKRATDPSQISDCTMKIDLKENHCKI